MICIDLAELLGITEDMPPEEVKKRCYDYAHGLEEQILCDLRKKAEMKDG